MQELVGVEAVPVLGVVGPEDAVAVALARPDARQEAVPVEGRALDDLDALLVVLLVVEAQLHALGVLGEEAEVRPVARAPRGRAGTAIRARPSRSLIAAALLSWGPAARLASRSSVEAVASTTSRVAGEGDLARLVGEVRGQAKGSAVDGEPALVLVVGGDDLGARKLGSNAQQVSVEVGDLLVALARELGALERRAVLRVGDLLAGELRERGELAPATLARGGRDLARRCGRRRTETAPARRTPRP